MYVEEQKLKQKESLRRIKHQQGTSNSQYGTIWITNGSENRKIKKSDEIPNGWRKGRFVSKTS
jgi:hypothetical protein